MRELGESLAKASDEIIAAQEMVRDLIGRQQNLADMLHEASKLGQNVGGLEPTPDACPPTTISGSQL